jgi:hypothetical protein
MPAMARASDAVVGDLSQSEIEQLHRILAKLEAHHQHLFTTGKEEALSALT